MLSSVWSSESVLLAHTDPRMKSPVRFQVPFRSFLPANKIIRRGVEITEHQREGKYSGLRCQVSSMSQYNYSK